MCVCVVTVPLCDDACVPRTTPNIAFGACVQVCKGLQDKVGADSAYGTWQLLQQTRKDLKAFNAPVSVRSVNR